MNIYNQIIFNSSSNFRSAPVLFPLPGSKCTSFYQLFAAVEMLDLQWAGGDRDISVWGWDCYYSYQLSSYLCLQVPVFSLQILCSFLSLHLYFDCRLEWREEDLQFKIIIIFLIIIDWNQKCKINAKYKIINHNIFILQTRSTTTRSRKKTRIENIKLQWWCSEFQTSDHYF